MASAELSPEGLLEAARHLVPTGRGRPRKPRLRRAISTAYYAAFVALTSEASVHHPFAATKHAVHRLVSHTSARGACKDLTSTGTVRWLPGRPECHSDLLLFARLFESLQDLRYLADYDHEYSCTKPEAVTALERADSAIEALTSARRQCPEQLDILCVATLADDRGRARIRR